MTTPSPPQCSYSIPQEPVNITTLYGTNNFADVTIDPEVGSYPGLPWWVLNGIMESLQKESRENLTAAEEKAV